MTTPVLTTVPMTPDQTISWEMTDLPEVGGLLFRAPECGQAAAEALRRTASGIAIDPEVRPGRRIGEGGAGTAYQWGPNLALKVMHEQQRGNHLEDLKANMALQHGLKRLGQPTINDTSFTTPQYLGAYFPYDDQGRGRAIWLMTYEAGMHRDQLPSEVRSRIPTATQRGRLYRRAIKACGLGSGDYSFETESLGRGNELFRVPPATLGGAALTIVRLDVNRRRGFGPPKELQAAIEEFV